MDNINLPNSKQEMESGRLDMKIDNRLTVGDSWIVSFLYWS